MYRIVRVLFFAVVLPTFGLVPMTSPLPAKPENAPLASQRLVVFESFMRPG